MLQLTVISVGNKVPEWVNQGAQSYLSRICGNTNASLIEIPAQKRGKGSHISTILTQESAAIEKKLAPTTRLICLDRIGKTYSSIALAKRITQWQQLGESISWVIGGPEGIDPALLSRADEKWSLSEMTFSHHVARIMLAEQLYRAWSITQGHPYHR